MRGKFFEKGNSWSVEERKKMEENLGQRVDEKCIRLILVPVSNIFCYGEFLIVCKIFHSFLHLKKCSIS